MALKQTDTIEVRWVKGKGRGVFARQAIREGEVFERASYCFVWGRGTMAVALGYGSLYNHSYRPNARYEDEGRQTKLFVALRDIESGEEITVNYNGDPTDRAPVGFEVIETKARRRVAH
jgi:uncharacterized protein